MELKKIVEKKYLGIIFVLVSVIVIDARQIIMKQGINQLGGIDFSSGIINGFLVVLTNNYVLLGVILSVFGTIAWLLALSKAPLSFAYPMLSIGYVFVSIFSGIFFNEVLSSLRLFGLGIIVGGVFLLSRT